MRAALVVAVVASGVAGAVACGAFTSDSDGDTTPPAADASDAPASDGGDPGDGGAPSDGGNADAPWTPPSLGDGGCAGRVDFAVCADFEGSAQLPNTGGFTAANGALGPDFAIVAAGGGAHELQAHWGAHDAGAEGTSLYRALAKTPRSLVFGARLHRGTANVDGYAELLVLEGTNFQVAFYVYQNALSLIDRGPTGPTKTDIDLGDPLLDAPSQRFDVQLWFEPNQTSVAVWVDGASVHPRTQLQSSAGTMTVTGELTFSTGIYYANGATNGWDVFFDDVTLASSDL